jgi:hypothetical protein
MGLDNLDQGEETKKGWNVLVIEGDGSGLR